MLLMRHRRFEVLDLKNRGGSAEHYWHFFLGILIPFANYLASGANKDLYFVRSCGPMDRFWRELKLDNVAIVDKTAIPQLAKYIQKTTLDGFDGPAHYNMKAFQNARAFLLDRCGNPEAERIKDPAGILMINRGPSDPYYNSSIAEAKTSASQRRSIPNFDELVVVTKEKFGKQVNVAYLESMSIAEQARIFSSAKVVVMQHGAALANILWMRPGSKLIEIKPIPDWVDVPKLCGMFEVAHAVVAQASPHAPVGIEAIISAI